MKARIITLFATTVVALAAAGGAFAAPHQTSIHGWSHGPSDYNRPSASAGWTSYNATKPNPVATVGGSRGSLVKPNPSMIRLVRPNPMSLRGAASAA
jgi:hypothetical protein